MNRELQRQPGATKSSGVWRWWPATVRGRVAAGLVLSLVGLLIAIALVVGSVWIENRFPSDDAKRALSPKAQRAVSRPIVKALSRQVERVVRKQVEAVYMETGLTLDETISHFLDERTSLMDRRNHAYRLARIGSPECLAALSKVLQTAPPEHKAFIAQLIGSTRNPAVKPLLWPLLDAEQAVAFGAIRGLSTIGDVDATKRIAEILTDGQRAEPLRVEAALGLGTIGTPAAGEALVHSFRQKPPGEVATQILNSLGRFEFSTVANVFDQYLAAPETLPAMRVTAVEALANSSTEAVPFLLGFARGDADANVRASAAWAISTHHEAIDLGQALTEMVTKEPAVNVRRRLYEALVPQTSVPAERLLPLIQAETDVAARVAGFNVVGNVAGQEPSSVTAVAFDQNIVPELLQIATTANDLNLEMRAVFALRRAQTSAAQAALAVIADRARPQIATAARNGLHAANKYSAKGANP